MHQLDYNTLLWEFFLSIAFLKKMIFNQVCDSFPLFSSSSVVSLTRQHHWSFGIAQQQLVVLVTVVMVPSNCGGLLLLGFIPRGLGNVISTLCVLISPHWQTAYVEWMYKCLLDGFLTLINRQASRVSTELFGFLRGKTMNFILKVLNLCLLPEYKFVLVQNIR